MDFEWVSIALTDVSLVSLAFALGFLVRQIGLPPLVGFLAAGFVLNLLGVSGGGMLDKIADMGITLLLFSIGLKLDLKNLLHPRVWAVTSLHIVITVIVFGAGIYLLALVGAPLFSTLDLPFALLVAFALSFSSTVFVVKVLEERGEMKSLHGGIAIGILIMQDLAAVIFLAFSAGKVPSAWALLLLLLILLRPLLHHLLQRTGHGELLILYGFFLALGGAELFELVGVKGDLGALAMGVLISTHPKASEMAKTLLGFKELFLVGFFLGIGLSGSLTLQSLLIGALLVPFIFLKSALFVALLTRFKLRARTALMASLNLTNYSEFGLIVAAVGVSNGWIGSEWLIVIAVALSLSFVVAAPLNIRGELLYLKHRRFWRGFQGETRSRDDQEIEHQGATVIIMGMGRVGTGAYDRMSERCDCKVFGIDSNPDTVTSHHSQRRNVVLGDPTDADFWDRVRSEHSVELVLLTLPKLQANLEILKHLRRFHYTGQVAALAKFPDEEAALLDAGASTVFNVYAEAGLGFADHALELRSA
ncbi:MAG: cation:proton antiporter family protein [Pseudomonadota bacterium]